MVQRLLSVLLLLLLLLGTSVSFTCPPQRAAFVTENKPVSSLWMSSGDPPRKRRVRRKEPSNETPPPSSTTATNDNEDVVLPTEKSAEPSPESESIVEGMVESTEEAEEEAVLPELKPRNDNVEFVVQDIRDIVSGKAAQDDKPAATKSAAADEEEDDDDDEDDDEYEWVDIDEEEDDDYEYIYETASGKQIDSLEKLLADARVMRESEKASKLEEEEEGEEGGINIPEGVSKAISTIVTVDFFFVCILLLWFLAGIFGQYVLKDTTIQIAFNNIFEPVVQPALGILMIGSAAGAIFKKDGEED